MVYTSGLFNLSWPFNLHSRNTQAKHEWIEFKNSSASRAAVTFIQTAHVHFSDPGVRVHSRVRHNGEPGIHILHAITWKCLQALQAGDVGTCETTTLLRIFANFKSEVSGLLCARTFRGWQVDL